MRLSVMLITLLMLSSCSTAGVPADAAGDGLPSLAALDSLHSASVAMTVELNEQTPLTSANVDTAESPVVFQPGDGIAWAIYRIEPPLDTPLRIQASGGGGLWLLVADYGQQRWSAATEFTASNPGADVDLSELIDPVSPAGYIYAAVVAPPGMDQQLDYIHYVKDGELIPPVAEYWVAPDGSDSNPGTQEEPWLTLQHAADNAEAGSHVHVLPGTYAGFHIQRSGLPGQPTIYRADGIGVNIVGENGNTADSINVENWGDGGPGPVAYVHIEGFSISGAARSGIRIVGSEEEHAHHITVLGCECDGQDTTRWGIFSGFASDLVVSGNTLHDSGIEHGMYLSNSGDRQTVRRNIVYDNSDSGIQFNADASLGGDGIMSDSIIEHNVIYNNGTGGGAALNMDGVRNTIIRGNLLYGNHATGLVMYSGDGLGSQDNLVVCNTIVQPDDGGQARYCVTINTDSGGNRLYNNVFHNGHSFRGIIDIDGESLIGFESDYNIVMDRFLIDDGSILTLSEWQDATGQDTHSVVATPGQIFADAAGDNYELKASSPAVDLGLDLGAGMPAIDLNSTPRPQGGAFDAGAYEWSP